MAKEGLLASLKPIGFVDQRKGAARVSLLSMRVWLTGDLDQRGVARATTSDKTSVIGCACNDCSMPGCRLKLEGPWHGKPLMLKVEESRSVRENMSQP